MICAAFFEHNKQPLDTLPVLDQGLTWRQGHGAHAGLEHGGGLAPGHAYRVAISRLLEHFRGVLDRVDQGLDVRGERGTSWALGKGSDTSAPSAWARLVKLDHQPGAQRVIKPAELLNGVGGRVGVVVDD